MKQLCVDCSWIDIKSQEKWDKAKEQNWVDLEENPNVVPMFDTWKPHCTHETAKRQPITDPVAGIHLDGPPWQSCRERRKNCPVTCRDYEERKEGIEV